MASFPGFYLTGAGMRLQAKAQSGVALVYTKMAVGDGDLPAGQNLEDLTALVNWKLDLGIDSVNALGDGTAHLKSILSNNGLSTGFVVKEMGIFAADPDDGEIMYAYTNAGQSADYLPASGGSTVIEKNITAIINIGNAANISITIPSANFATKEDLADYTKLEKFNEHQRVNRLWQPVSTYAVNEIVYSNKMATDSYKVFECVTGGKTGNTEPNWPAVGSTVVDGTVKWLVLDMRGVPSNQVSQHVRRDANGDFAARKVTATTFVGNVEGKADSATKLEAARTIAISGAVTGTATAFDGSKSISIATTGLDVGKANAGTLAVYRGGTGVTTLTGIVKGNGANAMTAAVAGVDYAAASHTHTTAQLIGAESANVAGAWVKRDQNGDIAVRNVVGNASTAAKLQKTFNINGVACDGSSNITLTPANIGAAPNASPALTGTPTAPTAAAGTNTTQLATTAFVSGAVNSVVSSGSGWTKFSDGTMRQHGITNTGTGGLVTVILPLQFKDANYHVQITEINSLNWIKEGFVTVYGSYNRTVTTFIVTGAQILANAVDFVHGLGFFWEAWGKWK